MTYSQVLGIKTGVSLGREHYSAYYTPASSVYITVTCSLFLLIYLYVFIFLIWKNLEFLEGVCTEESGTHHTLKMLLVFGG